MLGYSFDQRPPAPEPILGEGITNPVHAANAGKIVFSRQKIDRAQPDASQFANSFADGEHIYARFYVPTAIANHYAASDGGREYLASGYQVRLTVDGRQAHWGFEENLSSERVRDSTRTIELYPEIDEKAEDKSALQSAARWALLLRALPPGKHTLRMEVITTAGSFQSKTPAATGELTLDRTGAMPKIGFSFDKVAAGQTNAELERDGLSAVQRYARSAGWKEKFEKVKIASDGWTIQRHPASGIVVAREMTFLAYAVWPDGHCTYQAIGLQQAHDGTQFAGNLEYAGVGGQQDIDCDQ
jgi:hypothetical protein